MPPQASGQAAELAATLTTTIVRGKSPASDCEAAGFGYWTEAQARIPTRSWMACASP